MNPEFAVEVLRPGKPVQHGRAEELDPHPGIAGIGDPRMTPDDANPLEGFVDGLDLEVQQGVRVRAHQALAEWALLLAPPLEEQPRPRLAGA